MLPSQVKSVTLEVQGYVLYQIIEHLKWKKALSLVKHLIYSEETEAQRGDWRAMQLVMLETEW